MRADAPRVAIVGGGVSGLSAAHHILELAAERGLAPSIVVLESSDRVGGLIRTERAEGYLLEGGPDAILATKPGGIALCERLGLGDDLLRLETPPAGTQILHRGRLVSLPRGFLMMAPTRVWPTLRSPLFSVRGKLRMALERFVPPRRGADGDESLGDFVTRRFGREVLERVAEPVIASLFTADAGKLSVDAVMPRFVEAERRHGSVTRALGRARRKQPAGQAHSGLGQFAYLRNGLGSIVDMLVSRLPGNAIRTGAAVESVAREGSSGRFRIAPRDAPAVEADAVVFACPAFATASWMAALDPGLEAELQALRYASCATVSLAYRKSDLGGPPESFGFFVPRVERRSVLACSFVSVKFENRAPDDHLLVRVFLGGALNPEILDNDDVELARIADEELQAILGIRRGPVFSRVYRFTSAMPQYEVGWPARLERIRGRLDDGSGMFLAGGAVGAFGLPDCISSGERAAVGVMNYLGRRLPATVDR